MTMIRRTPTLTTVALLAALSLLAAACGGNSSPADPAATGAADATTGAGQNGGDAGQAQLNPVVASFDLAVEDDARFLLGLFTNDRELVLGGEVDLRFFHLGEDGSEEEVAQATATFLPVPGKEPAAELTGPTVVSPADGAGVYEATVDFDRPGIWGVGVTADVEGLGTVRSSTQFQVAEDHEVVAVGQPAPRTEAPLVGDDVPAVRIDSRAQGDAPIPDPDLHDTTVAAAVEAGRPVVVLVSTPTYCVSQFCGPITETVAELASAYGEVAEFVHLEVWKDFDASELNPAAAEWIQTDAGGNEPWTFLVGTDGTVLQRWDNVLDEAELVERLEAL
jgi:hypothetical protein